MTRDLARRALLATAGTAVAGFAVAALAQPATGPAQGNGRGYGPGMMGNGNGNGPGMMGNRSGNGPGMMGNGSGNGPGMMGGGTGNGPGMMGGRGGYGHGMMGGGWNTGSYLDALKSELGITPKEEPAWKEYADTISGVSEQMQGLHQAMFESMGTASWQERRNMMNQMFEARQQAYSTVQDAAKALMARLDPEQQRKARRILPGFGHGRGGMMGGRWSAPASR